MMADHTPVVENKDVGNVANIPLPCNRSAIQLTAVVL